MNTLFLSRPLNFLSLRWFRHRPNGSRQEIVADEVKYILTLYRRVLTIKDPVIDDSGPYECEASFQRPGQDALPPVSAVANLTVLVKPTFSAPPPSEINQDVLTTVVIPCKAVGSPPLNVRWYRNAVPVSDLQDPRISVLEDGQLHIGEAQPSDSGIFQCFVSNEAGPVNDASWVRILSKCLRSLLPLLVTSRLPLGIFSWQAPPLKSSWLQLTRQLWLATVCVSPAK